MKNFGIFVEKAKVFKKQEEQMSEEFRFMRGIVKSEDVVKLKRDMQDAIKGMELVKYLDSEEPILMSEARKYAEKEIGSFSGAIGLDTLPFLEISIVRAILHGFLINKRAHDRFWEEVDVDSTI